MYVRGACVTVQASAAQQYRRTVATGRVLTAATPESLKGYRAVAYPVEHNR